MAMGVLIGYNRGGKMADSENAQLQLFCSTQTCKERPTQLVGGRHYCVYCAEVLLRHRKKLPDMMGTVHKGGQGIALSQEPSMQLVEAVSHPTHYNIGKIEVISAITDWGLGFDAGNVVKYVARYQHKHKDLQKQIEDLKKARFYLNHLIETLETP
jgi:hypothetical protein